MYRNLVGIYKFLEFSTAELKIAIIYNFRNIFVENIIRATVGLCKLLKGNLRPTCYTFAKLFVHLVSSNPNSIELKLCQSGCSCEYRLGFPTCSQPVKFLGQYSAYSPEIRDKILATI